jgi:hypothetical protein
MRRSVRILLASVVLAGTAIVGAAGTAWPAAAPAASPANQSLAGEWYGSSSDTVVNFTATGPRSFTGEAIGTSAKYCLPLGLKVSGSGGRYTGTVAFYAGCGGSRLADGTITIDISTSGGTATATMTPPAGYSCFNCTPDTWTREEAGIYSSFTPAVRGTDTAAVVRYRGTLSA